MDVKTVTIKEKEARSFNFTAEVTGEVRKVTKIDRSFTANDGKSVESYNLEIALDDEDGERFFLYDKDISHAEGLEKGKEYIFKIRIDCDEHFEKRMKSIKISVISFIEK